MLAQLKEIIKFITSLRGLWGKVRQFATTSASPIGITNFIERNIEPEWADTLRREGRWNDIKNCSDLGEVRRKALGFAKDIPFFNGKSEEEVEDYVGSMGKNLGFLD